MCQVHGTALVLLLLYLPSFVHSGFASLKQEILEGYDQGERPGFRQGLAAVIEVKYTLETMYVIDQKAGTVGLDVYYRQYWQDSRLVWVANASDPVESRIGFLTFDPAKPDIWTPDLYYTSGLKITNKPGEGYIKVWPDGRVKQSVHQQILFNCQFDFKLLPFDTQECNLDLFSYGFGSEDLMVRWKTGAIALDRWEANGKLNQFVMLEPVATNLDRISTSGTLKGVRLALRLTRGAKLYVLNSIIPSVAFLAFSYTGFWYTIHPHPPPH
jgi:hypothetical protein